MIVWALCVIYYAFLACPTPPNSSPSYCRIPGSVIIRLSAPIKQHWADSLNLDLKELLSDGAYKEGYRAEMIAWGEKERAKDPGVFCRSAIQMSRGMHR